MKSERRGEKERGQGRSITARKQNTNNAINSYGYKRALFQFSKSKAKQNTEKKEILKRRGWWHAGVRVRGGGGGVGEKARETDRKDRNI